MRPRPIHSPCPAWIAAIAGYFALVFGFFFFNSRLVWPDCLLSDFNRISRVSSHWPMCVTDESSRKGDGILFRALISHSVKKGDGKGNCTLFGVRILQLLISPANGDSHLFEFLHHGTTHHRTTKRKQSPFAAGLFSCPDSSTNEQYLPGLHTFTGHVIAARGQILQIQGKNGISLSWQPPHLTAKLVEQ